MCLQLNGITMLDQHRLNIQLEVGPKLLTFAAIECEYKKSSACTIRRYSIDLNQDRWLGPSSILAKIDTKWVKCNVRQGPTDAAFLQRRRACRCRVWPRRSAAR